MESVYRSFETSLLALSFGLGLAALAMLGPAKPFESGYAVTLPMLTVTAPR